MTVFCPAKESAEAGMNKIFGKHLLMAVSIIFVIFCIMFFAGCLFRSSSSPFSYNAAISEGRTAAKEIMEKTGASSISLSFVDGDRLVWTESFGLADKEFSVRFFKEELADKKTR